VSGGLQLAQSLCLQAQDINSSSPLIIVCLWLRSLLGQLIHLGALGGLEGIQVDLPTRVADHLHPVDESSECLLMSPHDQPNGYDDGYRPCQGSYQPCDSFD